jgi:hypothetical protein
MDTGENRKRRILMNGDEIKKLRVIRDLLADSISVLEAAERLELSSRQVRRLKNRVKALGDQGVVHGLVGKPGNRSIPKDTTEKILSLWTSKYQQANLNFTHFTEKLVEIEKVEIGRETVRKMLRVRDLAPHRKIKKGRRHRRRRERKPRFGELLQQDTSPHDWLGIGEVHHMIAVVDDATSTLLYAGLFEADGTLQNMTAMKAVFAKYGLPWGIYTDKASWFHPSRRKSRTPFDPNAEIKKKPQSQIGRALEELGIEFIPAHSPQAKGRVERLNGVLQDRMIAELKLAKIKTLQDANHFIDQVFIPDYNRRFAIQAAEPQASAFVKLAQPKVLDDILCLLHTAQVQNDNTASRKNLFEIQCTGTAERTHWAKAKIEVRIDTEGKLRVRHAETQKPIPFKTLSLTLPIESKDTSTPQHEADTSKWQHGKKCGHF